MFEKEGFSNWFKLNTPKEGLSEHTVFSKQFVVDAWNDGYANGYNKAKTQWHKVSEQIPTEEKDYLVKLTDGTIDVMAVALDGDLEPYLLTPKFDFYKDVEKWCEIPKE